MLAIFILGNCEIVNLWVSQVLECVGWGCGVLEAHFFLQCFGLLLINMEFKNGVFNAARDGNLRRLKVSQNTVENVRLRSKNKEFLVIS